MDNLAPPARWRRLVIFSVVTLSSGWVFLDAPRIESDT
jgi:hypothetical protein